MRFKRVFFSSIVCVISLSMLVAAASAHGGHHGRGGGYGRRIQAQQTLVSVCTVDGCSLAGRHVHNGTIYCGYDHESGYCNGTCTALCPVDGCTVAGRHVHNNITYCGNDHICGFCDGSCSMSAYCGCHH